MARGANRTVALVAVTGGGDLGSDRVPPVLGTGLLSVTLLLTSLNLRAAASSVGPVLREVQADLGMGDGVAGVLTTLPALSFGVVGLLTARLGRRIGTEQALVASLVLIGGGLLVRAMAPGVPTLLLATLLALVGIAVANVLVPVAVKAWFPHDVGRMTGWYSTAITIGVAVPAAVTVPVAQAFGGWRVGLGIWAVPALFALVPWAMVLRRRGPDAGLPRRALRRGAPDEPGAASGVADAGRLQVPVHRQLRAWALMIFFAMQSLEAYTTMGWLPAILSDAGIGRTEAGVMLAVTMGLGAPVALVVPRLAARSPDQRPWAAGLTTLSAIAYAGLLVAPTLAWLWVVLLGVGLGAFPLALLLIGLRARTAAGTVALSSFVQGFGYLVAAAGPVAIGVAHERTGGWALPLGLLLALLVPKMVAGLIAAAPGTVDGPEPVTERG